MGEFRGDLKFLAGPGNTLNLFYRYSFQSLDYGFDDWVVISSVDFNFTAPKRVGGGLNNYHEDTAQLLNAITFENSGIITFLTQPNGLNLWGFYGREWNSLINNWDSPYPLFIGTDLQANFGPQKANNTTYTVYFGRYLPVFIDAQRQLYLVVQQDFRDGTKISNPWFIQIDLESHTVITKKEIPFFSVIAGDWKLDTKSNLILAGNSTNIVIQLEIDGQCLFVHYNGFNFSSSRTLPFSPAQWKVMKNGDLIVGGFDANQSLFRVYTLLQDDWVQKEFTILNTEWIKILDWELSNDKDIHIIAETPNGLEYAILNDTEMQIRDLGELNLTNILDMSLADNGTAYLGGMGSDDNLGVVKLSSNYPFYWYEATG